MKKLIALSLLLAATLFTAITTNAADHPSGKVAGKPWGQKISVPQGRKPWERDMRRLPNRDMHQTWGHDMDRSRHGRHGSRGRFDQPRPGFPGPVIFPPQVSYQTVMQKSGSKLYQVTYKITSFNGKVSRQEVSRVLVQTAASHAQVSYQSVLQKISGKMYRITYKVTTLNGKTTRQEVSRVKVS